MRTPKLITALDAVTATTTSSAIDVTCAKKITLLVTRAANAGGTSAFSVSGSINGIDGTYVTLNSLIEDLVNTNAQNYTRAASVSIANADGSKIAALDLEKNQFTHIKVTVTETADGAHTAKVLVSY
jgi:hypothetical protein